MSPVEADHFGQPARGATIPVSAVQHAQFADSDSLHRSPDHGAGDAEHTPASLDE